jgi:hypothetical protein
MPSTPDSSRAAKTRKGFSVLLSKNSWFLLALISIRATQPSQFLLQTIIVAPQD